MKLVGANVLWLYYQRTNEYIDISAVICEAYGHETRIAESQTCLNHWCQHAYEAAQRGRFNLSPNFLEELL